MKKDQIVSFPVAKLAYEKGFNWMNNDGFTDPDQTPMYFLNDNTRQYELRSQEFAYYYPDYSNTSVSYYAPTQTMLARFLREKENILVTVTPWYEANRNGQTLDTNLPNNEPSDDTFSVFIHKNKLFKIDDVNFETWEEAMEVGLLEALKLI